MAYILSLSYGKDSLACLGAVQELGLPLDRIIHAECMATPTLSADLPEMVDFKAVADAWILAQFGIVVEHVPGGMSYDECIRRQCGPGSKRAGEVLGWPLQKGPWCNRDIKVSGLDAVAGADDILYIGIASDESERLERLDGKRKRAPLAMVGWDEAFCFRWCEVRGLLSPIYRDVTRGGCWMCHNQTAGQLRVLRKGHPELWAIMLDWDSISPVPFKPGYRARPGHWVRDYERRFSMEDSGEIPLGIDHCFRWEWLDNPSLAWASLARQKERDGEYRRWLRKRERRNGRAARPGEQPGRERSRGVQERESS